jgi:hypothetical protein
MEERATEGAGRISILESLSGSGSVWARRRAGRVVENFPTLFEPGEITEKMTDVS